MAEPGAPLSARIKIQGQAERLDAGPGETGVGDFVRASEFEPRQESSPHRHDPSDGAAGPQRAHDAMGHGGQHGGMSMDSMVRDMRNRFVVAAVLSVPVLLWSPVGREVFGFTVPAPFGLRDDVFSLLLSLPVIFYSAWIFFDGAYRALKARTLDMMVLVAVGVGAGWLYSVG